MDGLTIKVNKNCVGCMLCVTKLCKFDAIREAGSVVKINKQKCVYCLECVRDCPYDAFVIEGPKMTILTHNCTNCGISCWDWCPTRAISFEAGHVRTIDPRKCVGCDFCGSACSNAEYSYKGEEIVSYEDN